MRQGQLALTAYMPVDEVCELIRTEVRLELDKHQAAPKPWLDVTQAARYFGYGDDRLKAGRRRIYDLVEHGRLECRRDGTRLLFRTEWLDATLSD